ncbi:hypothetical protein FKP32DRAFT_1559333 [Trametes sanguinea]|nr:hypothetical protein FKP32DRAFT_1559333 [Trametes sanguinea]
MAQPTTLLVGERLVAPPPCATNFACFRLLTCPLLPLEVGIPIRLALPRNPLKKIPLIPCGVEEKIETIPIDIWGPVVGIRHEEEHAIELVVDNWNEHSPIRQAFILAPKLPGASARYDVWHTVALVLRASADEVSPTQPAQWQALTF